LVGLTKKRTHTRGRAALPGLFFFGELGQARPGSAAASWSARAEHRILNEKGSADCADKMVSASIYDICGSG